MEGQAKQSQSPMPHFTSNHLHSLTSPFQPHHDYGQTCPNLELGPSMYRYVLCIFSEIKQSHFLGLIQGEPISGTFWPGNICHLDKITRLPRHLNIASVINFLQGNEGRLAKRCISQPVLSRFQKWLRIARCKHLNSRIAEDIREFIIGVAKDKKSKVSDSVPLTL